MLTFKYFRAVLGFFLCIFSCTIAAFPSHCAPSEYSIVDSWMGEYFTAEEGWRKTKNPKLVSLCADKKSMPFKKVTYRYGFLGRVELEVISTPRTKFKFASLSELPNIGDEVFFFKRGDYTYYLSVVIGKGNGVRLELFRREKRVIYHFSGLDEGRDYKHGPAFINYLSNSTPSSVFLKGRPQHNLH